MRHFDKNTDRIMMPSTFRWDARSARNERDVNIMKYGPLVMKIVNKYSREEKRIHIFNKHDLIQSGFVGLIEGYDRIIKSNGKVNVNYLERNIKGTIDRYLNYQSAGVAIPEYQIQKLRAEVVADRIFGAWMYSFRVDDINPQTLGVKPQRFVDAFHKADRSEVDSFKNEELNELLSDFMWQLTNRERDILQYSYGVNLPKQSIREIAKLMNLSEISIKKIKAKALKKLNTDKNRLFSQLFL